MKKIATILATASIAAFSTSAFAQEADSTFTGPRIGVIGGYDVSKAGSSVDDDVNEENDQSIDGASYGIVAGYDIDLGGIIVGAEAELADSTAEVEFDDGDFEGFGFGNVEANRDLYLGARVGGRVGPDAMIYAKGGYTNAKYDVRSNDGTTEFNQDLDLDGFRIGAGGEYALANNMYVNLEYRYSKYSEAEVDFDDELPDGERFDVDTDRHQVMAGVGMRF